MRHRPHWRPGTRRNRSSVAGSMTSITASERGLDPRSPDEEAVDVVQRYRLPVDDGHVVPPVCSSNRWRAGDTHGATIRSTHSARPVRVALHRPARLLTSVAVVHPGSGDGGQKTPGYQGIRRSCPSAWVEVLGSSTAPGDRPTANFSADGRIPAVADVQRNSTRRPTMICPIGRLGSDVYEEGTNRVLLIERTMTVKYMILTFASQQHYEEMVGQAVRPARVEPGGLGGAGGVYAGVQPGAGGLGRAGRDPGSERPGAYSTGPAPEKGCPVVTDGPYAEAEEVLAGYWVVECESFDRATEIAVALAELPGPRPRPGAGLRGRAADRRAPARLRGLSVRGGRR